MTRLIDADALKEYIDCGHLRNPSEVCFSEWDVVNLIDSRPTIDAVPVIRCKDCEFYSTYRILKTTERLCNHAAGLVEPRPRGHCNYAKRRKI